MHRLAPALLIAFSALTLNAQATQQRVAYGATCGQCRIELTKVATFDSPTDPIGPAPWPARDSRGRIFAPTIRRDRIAIFDSAGQYLGAFGGKGRGLGAVSENIGITQLFVGPGDTVFVLHDMARMTVFGPDQKFIRSVDLPAGNVTRAQALPDGNLIFAANYISRSGYAFPYHVLNTNGKVVSSFGDQNAEYFGRDFALAPDGPSLWTVPKYRIQQWGVNGPLMKAIEVFAAPWFPAPVYTSGVNAMGNPVMRMSGGGAVDLAGVDRDGLLWINAVRSTPEPGPRIVTRALEVFDPATGTMLVSQSMDLLRLVGNGYAVSGSGDFQSGVSLTVWRAAVRRQ